MYRTNSSRQIVAAKQRNCNYRPSGQIAQHVLLATIEDARIQQQVQGATATERMIVGNIVLEVGQHFYFVASKFAFRFYIVTDDGRCSSHDERVQAACVALVESYQMQRAAEAEKRAERKMQEYLNMYEVLAPTKCVREIA